MRDFIQQAIQTESKDFNRIIDRFSDSRVIRLFHAALGMSTEANEFLDALKKHLFYGKPLDYVNLKEEIGDQLWYMAIALDELGEEFEPIANMIIAKLRVRYPEKFRELDALNRNLSKEHNTMLRITEDNNAT